MIKDYSKLTERIYTQLSPELSQEFHNMLTDMAKEISRLYEIENAKPSDALECLHKIGKGHTYYDGELISTEYSDEISTIKQYILKSQEQEKILDILKRIIKIRKSDVYEFVLAVRGTDEEEDTIKEWLEK